MFAKLDLKKRRVVECDEIGTKVRGGAVTAFSAAADYAIAAEFGMKNAENASDSEIRTALKARDGKIISVDPDYFA